MAQRPQLGISIVAIVIGVVVSQRVFTSQWLRDLIHPPSKIERALRKHLGILENSPGYKARMAGVKDRAQASAIGKEAAHQGLKRLPGSDLEKWNNLRARLADGSPNLCAGFWSGNLDGNELQATLERLPDAELDDWLRISTLAAKLDLDNEGEGPAPADALPHALDAIYKRLPADDSARFKKDVDAGLSLGKEEGCWAFKVLTKNVATLDQPLHEQALRAIAAF
jgi:hypothetical protein